MPQSQSLLCNNVTTVFYLEDFYTTVDNKLTNMYHEMIFCTFNMDSM